MKVHDWGLNCDKICIKRLMMAVVCGIMREVRF
jgi:hypothetical protein